MRTIVASLAILFLFLAALPAVAQPVEPRLIPRPASLTAATSLASCSAFRNALTGTGCFGRNVIRHVPWSQATSGK